MTAYPDVVPGTVRLVDVEGPNDPSSHTSNTRHLLYVPQPSADPEDPLNWSRRRKFWGLAMTFVYVWGVGVPCTLHYSLLVEIAQHTGITIEDLIQGNGLMFLALGLGCLFWQALASNYGRRGVYVISSLLCVPIMVWTGYTTSAGSWLAHRVIIGFILAPIESLPEISIADLFFAHERGTWISIYVCMLFSSNFISPLMAGWMATAIGWRWTMFFGAFWAAGASVIIFFGAEETMFFRSHIQRLASRPMEPTPHGQEKGDHTNKETQIDALQSTVRPFETATKKLSKFRLITPNPNDPSLKQILYMMILPLAMIFQFPSIAWAGFIYGINLTWYLLMVGTAGSALSAAPYNWSTALIGCVYVGPTIGAILGCLCSGFLSDSLMIRLARKNGGIREPEQRLWALMVAGLASTCGLTLWGVGAAHGIHWIGLLFGLGILVFGVTVGGAIGVSYAVDCFKDISSISIASVIVVRNVVGFALSYAFTPWLDAMGLQNCFITAACISLACTMSFLLMTWKGKTLRSASATTYYNYIQSGIGGH